MSAPTTHLLTIAQRLPQWLAISLLSLGVIVTMSLIMATMLLPLWQRLVRASSHHSRQQQHQLRIISGSATLIAMVAPYLISLEGRAWLMPPLLGSACMIGLITRQDLKAQQDD